MKLSHLVWLLPVYGMFVSKGHPLEGFLGGLMLAVALIGLRLGVKKIAALISRGIGQKPGG